MFIKGDSVYSCYEVDIDADKLQAPVGDTVLVTITLSDENGDCNPCGDAGICTTDGCCPYDYCCSSDECCTDESCPGVCVEKRLNNTSKSVSHRPRGGSKQGVPGGGEPRHGGIMVPSTGKSLDPSCFELANRVLPRCQLVYFSVVGPVSVDILELESESRRKSRDEAGSKGPAKARAPVSVFAGFFIEATDTNAQVRVRLTVLGEGVISVYVMGTTERGNPTSGIQNVMINQIKLVTINADCQGSVDNPVSKLSLVPVKSYRHVHDAASVTVIALDDANVPVAGAKVRLLVQCKPLLVLPQCGCNHWMV